MFNNYGKWNGRLSFRVLKQFFLVLIGSGFISLSSQRFIITNNQSWGHLCWSNTSFLYVLHHKMADKGGAVIIEFGSKYIKVMTESGFYRMKIQRFKISTFSEKILTWCHKCVNYSVMESQLTEIGYWHGSLHIRVHRAQASSKEIFT